MKENSFEEIRKIADSAFSQGDFASALEFYKKCLDYEQTPLLLNRIGYVIGKTDCEDKFLSQIKYFKKALEIDGNYVPAIRNLALTSQEVCKYKEAEEYFKKLLELNPIPDDIFAYSCLKIRLGDFEKGWKFYDTRFSKQFDKTFYPEFEKPIWRGENLKNKTILVHFEQGFGDSIMFFRYVKQLKNLAKKVLFKVQDELFELFSKSDDEIEFIKSSNALKDLIFDFHSPLMSLPHLLKAEVSNIPFAEGYLFADIEKIEFYKRNYFNTEKIKIGFSWQGAHLGKQNRNIPLKFFVPLSELKNVKLYSFQKNVDLGEFNAVDLGKTFEDFSDTAAAMKNLDIFITSDNSLLNLAGALGVKTYLLLQKNAEWRWMQDYKKTPWYSSVKIFRQKTFDETWADIFERIEKDLVQNFNL